MPSGRLLHVGIDSTRIEDDFTLGRCGPVFTEESVICDELPELPLHDFKFIPTRETCIQSTELRTYDTLDLSRFLPTRFAKDKVHFDPDFYNFTYGEPADPNNRRALLIRNLHAGESLFFVSSLVPFTEDFPKANQVGRKVKYLVGGFKLKLVCEVRYHKITTIFSGNEPDQRTLAQIAENAHWKRPNDNFWCAVGEIEGRGSALFKRAFPLTQGSRYEATTLARHLYGEKIYQRGSEPIREQTEAEWLWTVVREYFWQVVSFHQGQL